MDFPKIESEFLQLLTDFDIKSDDIDADSIPEDFVLALVEVSACSIEASGLPAATASAFEVNLAALAAEAEAAGLADYANALAALLLVSEDTQAALAAILEGAAISLAQNYESVTCDGFGVYLPAKIDANTYEAFEAGAKSLDEPYSGTGDYDGDGVDNATELENVLATGGGQIDFADAASDPLIDGTGTVLGCASAPGQAPGQAIGDLLLAAAALMGLIAYARRRPARGEQS